LRIAQLTELSSIRTKSGNETPKLVRILAYFKRSQRGKLFLFWCALGVTVPSDSTSLRSLQPNGSEMQEMLEMCQNLVISPGWYTKFSILEEDALKGLFKAYDARFPTMDIYEFVALLVSIKLIPTRMTKHEAAKIFCQANRDEDAGDGDVFQVCEC
jgi:hypothetical protein